MNRLKAERRIKKKSVKVKGCPFCGDIPKITARCDMEHSKHGSWGHYVKRDGCCAVTMSGQTEIFFCNDFKKPDYKLWWLMFSRVVDSWNARV